MATSRRKQEERNLRVLREQGALEANRTCFDCRQRGTTYINMTIGSFVCTSCSGLLIEIVKAVAINPLTSIDPS
ncbi:Arf-GAP domain and FG repeat-containing protein 1 [Portunus trituberculatus]|uniref:Arf-GAP domain and FG repeat-containing protein 1 n=1 Tax=Portunus trituberculatus TaxID=210409 RepID=A0A5B7ES89_PORTR|nr:Arf-GAP domain and FG repeat-containing protein 1 [Portunus trituberculatus]